MLVYTLGLKEKKKKELRETSKLIQNRKKGGGMKEAVEEMEGRVGEKESFRFDIHNWTITYKDSRGCVCRGGMGPAG